MRYFISCLLLFISSEASTQIGESSSAAPQDAILEVRYVQFPPAFPFGTDSCKRFYFINFTGLDSMLINAVAMGDTVKYLRVYFSFIVDRNGLAYNARFVRVASTRYAKSLGAKTIRYFFERSKYYEKAIKKMFLKMPLWKPAIQNGKPVSCRMEDYIQFWVGLSPPS